MFDDIFVCLGQPMRSPPRLPNLVLILDSTLSTVCVGLLWAFRSKGHRHRHRRSSVFAFWPRGDLPGSQFKQKPKGTSDFFWEENKPISKGCTYLDVRFAKLVSGSPIRVESETQGPFGEHHFFQVENSCPPATLEVVQSKKTSAAKKNKNNPQNASPA